MNRPHVLLLALSAIALAACGGGDEAAEADSRSGGASVHTEGSGDDSTVVIQGEDGSEAVIGSGSGAASAAAAGPAYGRPYPGSEVTSSVLAPGQNAGLLTFTTDADADTVIAYYRERAEEAGFTAGAEMTTGQSRHYGAQSAVGGEFNVVATPQDGQTVVSVAWDGTEG